MGYRRIPRMLSRYLQGLSGGQLFALIAGIVFGAMMVLHWLLWLFARGRFKGTIVHDSREGLGFLVTDFFVKLIDDFRHLLALAIIAIFGGTILAVLFIAHNDFTN